MSIWICYIPGMKAYSTDLRQKIVEAYERRVGTQGEVAETFGVSQSFVEKLLHRYRTTGGIAPLPHGGGDKPLLDEEALGLLRRLVEEQPDATLSELCEMLYERGGKRVRVTTMWKALKRLDLRRKKVTSRHRAGQPQGREETRGFQRNHIPD